MKRRALLGAFLFGCHSTEALVSPPYEGAASLVTLAATDQAGVRAHAFNVGDSQMIDGFPSFSAAGDLRLFALQYGCSVRVLGLSPGLQELGEPGERVQLPPPLRVVQSAVVDGDQSTWVDLDLKDGSDDSSAVKEILRSLPLGSDNLCKKFGTTFMESDSLTITSTIFTGFALALDDSRALIALQDGTFYEYREDRPISSLSALEGLPSASAFLRDDGEIWLAGRDGRLAHGTLTTGFERFDIFTSTPAFQLIDISGSTSGPFELFMSNDNGTFERYQPNPPSWIPLSNRGDASRFRNPASVAWIGPGEAIAVRVEPECIDRNCITRFRNGEVDQEPVPPPLGAPGVVENLGDRGVFLGGDMRFVGRSLAGGDFEVFGPPQSDTFVAPMFPRFFAPTAQGFVFGLVDKFQSNLVQYREGVGFCPLDLATSNFMDAVTAMGDGLLVLSRGNAFGPEIKVQLFRRVPAEADACAEPPGEDAD